MRISTVVHGVSMFPTSTIVSVRALESIEPVIIRRHRQKNNLFRMEFKMKTKNSLLTPLAAIAIVAAFSITSLAQDAGVSPVYIPGTDLDVSKAVKTVFNQKADDVVKATTASFNKATKSTKNSPTSPTTTSQNQSMVGCGCDGGCDCDCDSGCDSGCCGDCRRGRARIGRNFFGLVRGLIPIKLSISRGSISNSCDDACDCGQEGCDSCNNDCGCDSGFGSRLRRLLPISVRLDSNHCCRYIGVFAGHVDLQDFRGNIGGDDTLVDFNDGWQFGIKRGRVFCNGFRFENELTYRHNTADTYNTGAFVGPDFVPAATEDALGSVYQLTSMTNVLRDLRSFGRTTPYVGLGAGGMFANGDIRTMASTFEFDDYTFAYQFIVGASRRLNSKATAFAEYKYFGTNGIDLEQAGVPVGEYDFQSNNVIFGLRWDRPR
jgi:opacity protein-like surface antigen